MDDPKVFTRPWKISVPLYRLPGEESQLLDFKCVEKEICLCRIDL